MANETPEPDLPPRLVEDLSKLYGPVAVPSRMDDAILNRARAQLAGRTRRIRFLRWAGAAAAAACLALVLRFAFHSSMPNDFDGNDRVDIVDALVLARQIESGKGEDINGDGFLDHRDVDAIAMMVVELDEGVQ